MKAETRLKYQISLLRHKETLKRGLLYFLLIIFIFGASFFVLHSPAFYLRIIHWGNFQDSQPVVLVEEPASSSATTTRPEPPIVEEELYDKPDSIIIEKIQIEAPLVFPAETASQRQITESLNQGIVHQPGTALPGEKGNTFFSGHSSVYPWIQTQYGHIFALLDKLEVGDAITIYYQKRKYDYQVVSKAVISPAQLEALAVPGSEEKLTLSTCWPIGTSWKRLVIEAKPVAD